MVEKKYIAPNAITAANMLLGYLSIIFSIKGNIDYAIWFIFLAMVCDGLDGKTARKLDAFSEFGKEFDSFSDAISFGIAPSILVYSVLSIAERYEAMIPKEITPFVVPVAFIYALCGVMRLVKFNVVTVASEEKDDFSGMPIPNGAATVISYLLICNTINNHFGYQLFSVDIFIGITIISAVLMVSTIPFLTPDKVFKVPKKFMSIFVILILVTLKYSMFIVSFYYIIYNLLQFYQYKKEMKHQIKD